MPPVARRKGRANKNAATETNARNTSTQTLVTPDEDNLTPNGGNARTEETPNPTEVLLHSVVDTQKTLATMLTTFFQEKTNKKDSEENILESVIHGRSPANPTTSLPVDIVPMPTASPTTSNAGLSPYGVAMTSCASVDIIHDPIRNFIEKGKDVNLAILLMPPDFIASKALDCKDSQKKNLLGKLIRDARVCRDLSLSEFIRAFSMYKNVMVGKFPGRREELDSYLNFIIELATSYPAKFYQYHKAFSARAAALLEQRRVLIDWSIPDHGLVTKIFAGCPADVCRHCKSVMHSSEFCDLTRKDFRLQTRVNPYNKNFNSDVQGRMSQGRRSSDRDIGGRKKVFFSGMEICNNYNFRSCTNGAGCRYAHVCVACFEVHPVSSCPVSSSNPLSDAHSEPAPPQPPAKPTTTPAGKTSASNLKNNIPKTG